MVVRVKIATGSGDETVDVNLSKFDPKSATAVEMFAYCQYKDAIGEGVNSKWGSWNAMKNISSPYDGCDFGSLDNIMNKKMNWSGCQTANCGRHKLRIDFDSFALSDCAA